MPETPDSQELFRRFRDGEDLAATEIFNRYVTRLLALARSRLGKKIQSRFDAEDVVQSAYQSFFVRAKDDQYQLERSGDLWRLLAGITINKLYGQIEKQATLKRDPAKEEAFTDASQHWQREPSVAEAIGVAEELNLGLAECSQEERFVLLSHLQGRDTDEIAIALGKSPRTARRLLGTAKQKIEQRLLSSEPATVQRPQFDRHLITLRYEDFRLEQLLGAGAVGKVYRATQLSTHEAVAIKAIQKSHQQDGAVVAEFVKEAQILAELSHPNVVKVRGLGQFPGGGLFIAMQYVDGGNLQDTISKNPPSLAEVITIAQIIAHVMAHLHDLGIVHGDLKPANVLVDRSGHLYVVDFGFARLANDMGTSQLVGGTFGFIAPEILEFGVCPSVSSDIYAFGVLLGQLLKVCRNEEDLRYRQLERIRDKCTQSEVTRRFASAAEIQAALR